MMLLRNLPIVLLSIATLGCQSTTERAHAVRASFLQDMPAPETWTVATQEDTLQLPLPPSKSLLDKRLATVQRCAAAAKEIAVNDLPEPAHADWNQFQQSLQHAQSMLTQAPMVDAAQYVPDELLRHFQNDEKIRYPALLVTLIHDLPGYWERVAQSFPYVQLRNTQVANTRGVAALAQLEALQALTPTLSIGYREQLDKEIPKAVYSLKDYLAHCQSKGSFTK